MSEDHLDPDIHLWPEECGECGEMSETIAQLQSQITTADRERNDALTVAARFDAQLDRQKQALVVAMAICDAIGSEAHNADPDSGIKYAGELVNLPLNGGRTGYVIIRDALAASRETPNG